MTFIFKPISLLVALTIALSGCAGGISRTEGQFNRTNDTVNAGLARFDQRAGVRAGGAQFSDGIYVGATPERRNAAVLLPSRLQAADAVRLQSRDPMGLTDIAQRLSEITGVPHLVALGPTGQVSEVALETLKTAEEADQSEAIEALARSLSGAKTGGDVTMRPNLKGPLSGILDEVGSTFDVEWSFSDGRVIFRDFITRQYQISALPSATQSSSSVGSDAIQSSSSLATDVWSEIRTALDGIVGDGANVSIGAATGMVTITARVSDQNRVQEYIQKLNMAVGQQITFDVNILTVALSDENAVGIDLQRAFQAVNAQALGAENIITRAGAGVVNIGLIDGDVDISAVAKALATQGKVSVTTRAGATTSNNRVAPIEVVDQRAYLREVALTTDSNGQSRTSRTADTVTTGFQMQLFPRILNTRDIMVQYSVRLSELNDIKVFGDGNEAIQLPEVSTTSFEQQAVLENGQTLILAGFERNRAEVSNSKGLFGASMDRRIDRVATLIMITPRIVGRTSTSPVSN